MAEGQTEIADATANAVQAAEKKDVSPEKNGAPAKPKKRKSSYSVAAHPPCIDMIIEAVSNLADKNGSSFQAIKKYIVESFDCDMDTKFMPHIKKALKSGVASGKLVQMKGKGASGSFKIGNVVQTMLSKPTKRQIASADAAARKAAKEQQAAKRAAKLAKRPKKKKQVVQKPAARKSTKKSSMKKKPAPAAKKATEKRPAKSKGKAKKGARKGKK